jgi:hypothetical protein
VDPFSKRHKLFSGVCVNETVPQLFTDFNKAYDSVRREVLYSILIEFVVPLKLVRMIKMCIYSIAHIGKYLHDTFNVENDLKQDVLSPLFSNFVLKYAKRKVH